MIGLPILPDMRCDAGCGECCGIVAATEDEYQRVKKYAKRHGIKPVEQGGACPWYQGGTCAVYPARPTVCRLFGHVERLTCPHGYNVNVSAAVEDAITEYQKPDRLLHEALPNGLEIVEGFVEVIGK